MTVRLRVSLTATALAAALLAAGCAQTTAPAPGAAPVDPTTEEQFTPLIITALAPDPAPVTGTDGKVHLAYELTVLNDSPRPATISQVDTLANGPQGRVLGSLSGPQVVARSLPVGDYPVPSAPAETIAPGGTLLLILDAAFDAAEALPATLVHRIAATFGPIKPHQAEYANNFPDHTTQLGGAVTVGRGHPIVIGPPLTGNDWVAVNACCELSPHRGAMVPIGGRINGAERYAVDFSRFDLNARPIVDLTTNTQADFRGDPTRNESYFSFDQPVLAVADAAVVRVVDDLPEATPRHITPGIKLDDLGGNRVILDLGNGVYAFYAHLKTGGVQVHVGDHVTRGQQIARTGNSGNTTASHLHFHLMDSPLPLTATNIPFEIDRFTLDGSVTPEALVSQPAPGPRTDQLPLINSAVNFPG
jgi:hypothetical protein